MQLEKFSFEETLLLSVGVSWHIDVSWQRAGHTTTACTSFPSILAFQRHFSEPHVHQVVRFTRCNQSLCFKQVMWQIWNSWHGRKCHSSHECWGSSERCFRCLIISWKPHVPMLSKRMQHPFDLSHQLHEDFLSALYEYPMNGTFCTFFLCDIQKILATKHFTFDLQATISMSLVGWEETLIWKLMGSDTKQNKMVDHSTRSNPVY